MQSPTSQDGPFCSYPIHVHSLAKGSRSGVLFLVLRSLLLGLLIFGLYRMGTGAFWGHFYCFGTL